MAPNPSLVSPPPGPRRGNYAILIGVSFTTFLGFAAVAIDSSYVTLAFIQAQAAADAGAHAAMVEMRTGGDVESAQQIAELIVNENNLMGAAALVDIDQDVLFGGWDYDTREFDESASFVNAVQVNVRKTDDSPNGAMDTLMVKMFGVRYTEAQAQAPSTAAIRFRDIIVVQDVTGSFAQEMGDARAADLLFLDTITENDNPGDRIGMVTFVGAAEEWTELSFLESEYSTVYNQWSNLDWCNRSYWPWYYYGPPYYHYAPQMMDCAEGQTGSYWYYDSGTNQGAGLDLAVEILTDDTSLYSLKTIVLVSDGRPQCVPSTPACDSAVAAEGVVAADLAEDEEISIFTVSFNETYNATQSAYMESLVRGYGRFYETPDSEDLEGILEEIARSVPIALVE